VQSLLDVELVRAQHHHVDIAVIADRLPHGELDRVPARGDRRSFRADGLAGGGSAGQDLVLACGAP
jgi:hypothetical protein